MTKWGQIFLIAIIFSIFLLNPGIASELASADLWELSIEELLDINIVTSNKRAERLLESPAVVNVFTVEDMRLLNINSLQEAMEYMTGLASWSGENNIILSTTTIRGNTLVNYQNNTLLLFDGIPLYSPYHGSFDFSWIPLSSIARIEIVKGANSVLYGTNAINAVINIISRDGEGRHSEYPNGFKLKFGTHNTVHVNDYIIHHDQDLRVKLFADGFRTDGEVIRINDEDGNILDFAKKTREASGVAQISYKKLDLHFQIFGRDFPNYKTRGFNRLYSSAADTVGFFVPEQNEETGFVTNLRYSYPVTPNVMLKLRSSYFRWELHKDNGPNYWDYESDLFSNDLECHYTWNENTNTIFGASLNYMNGRRFRSERNDYDIGRDDEKTTDIALFANGNYRPQTNINLFYGVRYYYSSYRENSADDLSLRAALTYQWTPNFFSKVVYGESFRVPTYFERETDSSTTKGNPALDPETSQSIDLLFSGLYKGIRFDAGIFQQEIKDKIIRVDMPDEPGRRQLQNTGEMRFFGAEANVKFRLSKFTGFLGYAYVEGTDEYADDFADDEYEEKDLDNLYHHMFSFATSVRAVPELELLANGKYLGEWGPADRYLLLNLGVAAHFPAYPNVTFEGQIGNILEETITRPELARQHELVQTYPLTDERLFYVGMSYRY